jgi:hypothetical protein
MPAEAIVPEVSTKGLIENVSKSSYTFTRFGHEGARAVLRPKSWGVRMILRSLIEILW